MRLPLIFRIGEAHLSERIDRIHKKAIKEIERKSKIQEREQTKRTIKEIGLKHDFYQTHDVIFHMNHPNFKRDMINYFHNHPSNIEPFLFSGAYKAFHWIQVTKKPNE